MLAIRPERTRDLLIYEQRRQYETFAELVAIALERVHYVDVARDALVKIESESLRNSLLAALSHDLRTPLAVLLGLGESLALTQPPLSGPQAKTVETIGVQTRRLIALVNNLLDMARIQSGEVRLNRQWLLIEEVVGSALRGLETALKTHPACRPATRPAARGDDAVLVERVLANLLENAAKFTPAGTPIDAARPADEKLEVSVSDQGSASPPGRKKRSSRNSARQPGIGNARRRSSGRDLPRDRGSASAAR